MHLHTDSVVAAEGAGENESTLTHKQPLAVQTDEEFIDWALCHASADCATPR